VENVTLSWGFRLPVPLQVQPPRAPMSFDLQMPCFFAIGAIQSAIFVIDHADPTLTELSLEFTMPGLKEIQYSGRVFQSSEKVSIHKIDRRMQLLMVYEVLAMDDITIAVVISMVYTGYREPVQKTEIFQPPPIRNLGIILVNESNSFQQFLITNNFLTTFSFFCDGRKHQIHPNSKYNFIRAGNGPLSLEIIEEGWEKFPVLFEIGAFESQIPIVELDFDSTEWISGDPRFVRVGKGAAALSDQNWIILQHHTPGDFWILIPKRPGVLKFPEFRIGQQICRIIPQTVRILPCECPPLIPF
jgi:hypothetical protein